MAYKALYREFRPRRFEDLKGQGAIAAVLKNQVRLNEPSHAYLFSGPRGTGKTSTAKILACALNCEHPEDGEPCLKCENCREALADDMIDIIEMDAASNNSVDNARDIRDKVGLLPAKGKYKVYIIDEVHMLSTSAFNALLKTLEEPPAHVVFILATTELGALPKTVLSRCQRFDFKHIEADDMISRMQEIIGQTGSKADEEALKLIADASEGALRDALTVLDQCCVLTDHVTVPVVAEVLGYADSSVLLELLTALGGYEEKSALIALEKILGLGIEAQRVTIQMMDALEQMLYASITGSCKDPSLTEIAKQWGKKMILRGLRILAATQNQIKFAARPSILLEMAVVELLLPETEEETSALEYRIDKLEKKLAQAQLAVGQSVPSSLSQQPRARVPQKVRKADPQASAAAGPIWEELKKQFSSDLSAKPFLSELVLTSEDAGRICLTSENNARLRMFADSSLKREMEKVAEEKSGRKVIIEVQEMEQDQESLGELYGDENIDIID